MSLAQHAHIAFLLVQNGALLALGVIGYCQVRQFFQRRLSRYMELLVCGFVFGTFGLISMLGAVDATEGVRLDLRNALIAVATALYGLEAGTVAFAVIALGRIALGGSGVMGGIFSLSLAFALSAALADYLRRRQIAIDHRKLTGLGLGVGISGLCAIAFFPRPEVADQVLHDVAPSWVILMPLTVIFLGSIVLYFERTRILGEALRQREGELSAIMDNSPMAIFLKDREGRYRLVNRTYTEWSGLRPEDLYGRTSAELFPLPVAEEADATDQEVLAYGRVTFMEIDRRRFRGQFPMEHGLVTKFPIRDESGAIVGIAGFNADITDRKRAEETLRQSEALLAESQRLGRVAYILVDVADERVYWSDSLFELRRVPRRDFFTFEEAIQFIHPADRETYYAERDAAVAGRRDFTVDVRIVRGDGSVGWEQSVGHPRFDRHGNLASILVVLRDVTESKAAEQALRQSEERFRALVEYSADTIAILRPDGTMAYRSPSRSSLGLGYDEIEVIGRRVFDRLHPEDVEATITAFNDIARTPGAQASGRSRMRHKSGSWRHIAWSARNAVEIPGIDGIIVNALDVTDSVTLEMQLLQARKMEAIGQLAGGIAHDFNSILGAILGFAGFLLQDLPAGTAEHGFAARIVKAGGAARDLVGQILAFSRRSDLERKPHDLVRIMLDTGDLLRASLPSSTRLEIVAPSAELIATVNAAQIGQIILNLGLNANDALRSEPGEIKFELAQVDPKDSDDALSSGDALAASAGRIAIGALHKNHSYARLTVRDTGIGMQAGLLEHIFDPFFTTKERGHGTGLGLAVVHGTVIAYDGACMVASQPGAGSVFTIYLPLAPAGERPAPPEHAAPLRGRERILVIDDEVDLTDMLAIGLDRLGYEVVALNDPEEAATVFAEEPGVWDVVVSDQVMPQLKGLSLLTRLKAIRPAVRFILCTGFSDGATEELALAAGVDAFFLKPISAEQLAAAIRRMIDGPSAAA